ncbi:MAG: rRNA maturation RNase YbeY [Bacteroidales bacterium]
MITYLNKEIKFNFTGKRICSKWIKDIVNILSKGNFTVGQINIVFCNDDYILSVNNEFLKHNYYTDIITFDYTQDNVISGDLIISVDTVNQNSVQFKTLFKDELNRVIIHGVLHLLGYKDKSNEEKLEMRETEDFALSRLKSISYD